MPEQPRTYINLLNTDDHLIVRKVTSGRQVVEFFVQYEAHRHVCYPDGLTKRFKVTKQVDSLSPEEEE